MKRFSIFALSILLLLASAAIYLRKGSAGSDKDTPSANSATTAKDAAHSHAKGPVTQSKYACTDCNVVVVLIDTLRADHLPFYGYDKNTAPFLTTVANKGVVFERAFSASSWTAPATATVFTSLFPSQHGVITGFAATKQLQKREYEIQMNRIPKEIQTLGEYMQEAGFVTVAVTDNLNIGPEMGFDRGFKYFQQYRYDGAAAVNKKAIEFMDKAGKEGRFFLYLHYMDPHSPYNKREPFYSECAASAGKDRKKRELCSYDSEIIYADEHISKLFDRYQFLDNSVVIILSDHGEEFWEHGGTGHGKTLYTEVIHVPLVLYFPGVEPKRITDNVHTMDLLPTLSTLLQTSPNAAWVGQDLLRTLDGTNDKERDIISDKIRHPAIAEKRSKRRWTKRSVVRRDWHYIQTEDPGKETGKELFDLKSDFFGLSNLSSKHPEVTTTLQAGLEKYPDDAWQKYNEGIQMEVDQELLNNLKSLGYVE